MKALLVVVAAFTPALEIRGVTALLSAILLGLLLARLVRVLEDLDGETRPVHAVMTPTKAKTRAVRSAVECLQAAFDLDGDQRSRA